MTTTRPGVVNAYRRAFAARGNEQVTFTRIDGVAPNAQPFNATVTALVMGYEADTDSTARTGYGQRETGAITQGSRTIVVLADDLTAKRFPLPLQKNDKVLVRGEQLNIIQVDPMTRELAGAIELKATGV